MQIKASREDNIAVLLRRHDNDNDIIGDLVPWSPLTIRAFTTLQTDLEKLISDEETWLSDLIKIMTITKTMTQTRTITNTFREWSIETCDNTSISGNVYFGLKPVLEKLENILRFSFHFCFYFHFWEELFLSSGCWCTSATTAQLFIELQI